MTHEAIIEKVKKKYAGADEATIHSVLQTLQDAKVDLRWPDSTPYSAETIPQSSEASAPLKFIGEHLTLEQYRRLSLSERGALKRQLKQQNREWLEKAFSALRAAWIMVMDGEIIAHGASLKDYPSTGKIREIGTRHGKRPFIFVNDLFMAIEESRATWHPTIYDEVKLPSGEILSRKLTLNCVTNWRLSSFVNINPRRTAFVRRNIFLELPPSLTLDFANHRTTISAPTTA
jgi:hypothetical protein